ncbi:DUF1264-domain-containing protein [Ophiobolus disseminans]|uniref:DUF1264-domain-containing protein n=1 Tax=Ophiobolus disseminans TaxID=1469910 RepID=A0A6A6ZXN9_9PLEO|nr:DUF1264-domain-containing protein [Ophiobolus disseminans]
MMDSLPVTNNTLGEPESATNKTLETGASMVQNFAPVQRICAHLNAFHAYAHEPTRPAVEANHYCAHLNDDVRQCILYDSPTAPARIIGIEYMITPKLFHTLDPTEQKLWHTHVFEVKSGMLIMPKPSGVPEAAWEIAETKEMEEVVQLYGKVYHLWQTDRGDKLPLGEPQLMTSYTAEDQMPDFEGRLRDRDGRFGADWERKKSVREYIGVPEVRGEADATWAKGGMGHV